MTSLLLQRITARHFAPGMVLLRKTGIGATWSPAIVNRIEAGLLYLKSESGELFDPVPPSSPSLAPVGLYPDEINAVVNKGMFELVRVRTKRSMTSFLS